MKLWLQQRGATNERALLDALEKVLAEDGHEITRRRNRAELAFVWNGRDWHHQMPTIYCEQGWLPRWAYQMSWRGINARSHLAQPKLPNLNKERRAEATAYLETIRSTSPGRPFNYCDPTVKFKLPELPDQFILVPLQDDADTNMLHAPAKFRTAAGLIAHLSDYDPPLPLVFKEHPAHRAQVGHVGLKPLREGDLLVAGPVHAYLAHEGCTAVVTVNSNVANDALLWGVPVVALGSGIWPTDGPFWHELPKSWKGWARYAHSKGTENARLAYAWWLSQNQWTPDAIDPKWLNVLMADAIANAPEKPKRATRSGPIVVNAYARNMGWLFEDLKAHFAAVDVPGVKVTVSELPDESAHAWICLRTNEAEATPEPESTVVQVHDLFDRHGNAREVNECGGLCLTHPEQLNTLRGGGVKLNGKRIMLRPVGALDCFRPDGRREGPFTLGWSGRPVNWQREPLKGTDLLAHGLGKFRSRTGESVRVILVGAQLDRIAKPLRSAGAIVEEHEGIEIEAYPELYNRMDALLVGSKMEAGPLPLFEALACGVPVVSTDCGWARHFIVEGCNGYVYDGAPDLADRLFRIYSRLEDWRGRASSIRATGMGWSLEAWCEECVEMAVELVGEVA